MAHALTIIVYTQFNEIAQPADLEGMTLLRPDILFYLLMLIAVIVYGFRHPDINAWQGH